MPQNMPPPSHQLQRAGLYLLAQRKRPEALLLQVFRPFECPFGLNSGGAKEDRTPDLVDANDALSQLSYGPTDAAAWRNRPRPYRAMGLV